MFFFKKIFSIEKYREFSFALVTLLPAVHFLEQAFAGADFSTEQGGINCGAIDEPRKSSKAIDERVIINFCDKNVVIARFRDKNVYR